MKTPEYLRDHADEIRRCSVDLHTIEFHVDRWSSKLRSIAAWPRFADAFGQGRISRRRLFDFQVTSPLDVEALFVGVMAWGYGTVGYGPWRTAHAFSRREFGEHVQALYEKVAHGDLIGAYELVDIPRCGSAFFTKFFYFVGRPRLKRYPLILDAVVARSFEELLGLDLSRYARAARNRERRIAAVSRNATGYMRYIDDMHQWAADLDCRADEIEMFLFQRG